MPWLETKHNGAVTYSEDSVLTFPSGLPGFDKCRQFLFLHKPVAEPLIFMQSLDDHGLCFIVLPILVVDSNYVLQMTHEEMEEIGLQRAGQPQIGKDVFCGALICAGPGAAPTANLLAPIVVNLSNRIGIQVIQSASGYSHEEPLLREGVLCS
jgi:flagellar assembly factor FliW